MSDVLDVHEALASRGDEVRFDPTDGRILALLCEDGRMSIRTLAQRAGVSRAAAYARIDRLRAAGVITGFSAKIDLARLGLPVVAHIYVTVRQSHWRDALSTFRSMPEVAYCAALAADHDVLLIVRVPHMRSIRDVVLERLHRMPSVTRTRTLMVLEEDLRDDGELLTSAIDWTRAEAG